MIPDNIVIIIDTGNYKDSYAEPTPFRARIIDKYDNCVVVKSMETNKEYELYYYQVLEFLDLEEIKELIKCGT